MDGTAVWNGIKVAIEALSRELREGEAEFGAPGRT